MGGGMLNLGDRNSPQSTVCATAWDALKPHVPSHFPLPRTRRSCMLSCMDSMFSMRRSLCFMTCFSSLPAACGHGREGGAERARWVLEPRAWGLSCTAAERRRPAGSLGRLPGADGITNRTKAPTPSTGVSASTSTHTHTQHASTTPLALLLAQYTRTAMACTVCTLSCMDCTAKLACSMLYCWLYSWSRWFSYSRFCLSTVSARRLAASWAGPGRARRMVSRCLASSASSFLIFSSSLHAHGAA